MRTPIVAGMRTPIVAGILLLLMTAIILQHPWFGDFWEHAAVVRELATHPLSPRHPLLSSDAPHAFFSPYALAVAGASRALGSDPVTTLAAAGIGNFGKLLAFSEKLSPLRRNVSADEVGNVAAFLLSELSSGMTGEVTFVDAGFNTAGAAPFD